MTDRETLYKGLSHAAWGYFFLNFNLNLNNISVTPHFVGYILFFLAIQRLAGERRDLNLLKPLSILLVIWHALDWVLSWGGVDLDGQVLFLDLLITAAGLYFQFQFLTDMAALAETYRPSEDNDLDARLLRRRTAYIVLVTVTFLFSTLLGPLLDSDWRTVVVVVLAITGIIVSLMIMAGLFELRKFFLPDAV